MAKTVEQKKAEFTALMNENGFTLNGEAMHDGRPVYSRRWTKKVEVLWRGTMDKSLEIKVDEAHGIPMVRVFKDGRQDAQKGYTSTKRMINALREITGWAGFEF